MPIPADPYVHRATILQILFVLRHTFYPFRAEFVVVEHLQQMLLTLQQFSSIFFSLNVNKPKNMHIIMLEKHYKAPCDVSFFPVA